MGLYDRGYMHRPDGGFGGSAPDDDWRKMLWILIGVNAALFLLAPCGSPLGNALILEIGAVRHGELWRIATAGFLHRDFFHILFNMWGLYLFGGLVGPAIGGRRFLVLYLLGVVIGNGAFLLFNWNAPPATRLLGASGAVCAVMAAAALLEPDRQFVLMFLPFWPMKTATLVVCYTIVELLSEVFGAEGGIAHLAHLGGFAAGYFYLKALFGARLAWDPFRRRVRPVEWHRPPPFRREAGADEPPRRDDRSPVSSQELDRLLDKISREGINALSEYELGRLRQAREQMRGGRG